MSERVILVDAVNTYLVNGHVDPDIKALLDTYPNKRIVVTNANAEQRIKNGLDKLPDEIFTLEHEPDKVDPRYFVELMARYDLPPEAFVYFEHNPEAVASAQSVGIASSYHFDPKERDLVALREFLDEHVRSEE